MVNLAGVDPNARRLFEALQSQWGGALPVTSAYRSPGHNAKVGGAKHSRHMKGDAFDIDTSGMSPEERNRLVQLASAGGFTGFGGYDNSIHLDTGDQRTWGPDYTSGTTPDWLKGALKMRQPIRSGPLAAPGQDPQMDAVVRALMLQTPPEGSVAQQQAIATGPNVNQAAPLPEGQSPANVADLARVADAAGLRADEMVPTNITKGLAHLANRGVEAFGNIKASKLEDKRQRGLAGVLGGVGGEITDEQIRMVMALDPEMGQALMAERFRQRAGAEQAAAAAQAAQAKQAFTAEQADLNRRNRLDVANIRGRDGTNVTVNNAGDTRPQIGTIPQGWEAFQTPEGAWQMRPIEGGPAAVEAAGAAEQAEEKKEMVERQANIVLEDIDKVLESEPEWSVGFTGNIMSAIPGTPAHDIARTLDTIKSNIGFDKLQAMRDASPTGGALGQVSEFENRLLQSTMGSLDQAQSPAQFTENLKRVREVYLDIIHGKGNRPGDKPGDDDVEDLLRKYE